MATYDLTSSIPTADKLATGDILNCPYSGTYKQITLPKGQYKLEVWGAEGGYRSSSSYSGKGGYSVGTLTLTGTTTLYLYAGGAGNTAPGSATIKVGGFNGGGYRYTYSGGGGGSDVRIGSTSLYARVIVAGGGGSDGKSSYKGGNAGADSGDRGSFGYGSYGYGGTQISTSYTSLAYISSQGTTNSSSNCAAGFGFGGFGVYRSSGYGGAGGGGWYGGQGTYPDSSVDDDGGGGGGSGYVYTSSTASNYPSGCLLNSSYYLSDTNKIGGGSSMTSPTGNSETGHSGNGYVRITVVNIRLEKPYLENLLKYGDFEGEGWTNTSLNTFAYDTTIKLFGTKSLKITSNNSGATESYFYHNANPAQVKGHIYYVCCHIYLPAAGATTQMQAYWPEAESSMGNMYVDQNKVGQWQRISMISTRSNWDSGEQKFRFDIEAFQSPSYVYLDGAMLIDLTDCYGEGNEPSKEWCDANISFFTGMIQREVKQVYIKMGGVWKSISNLSNKISSSWKTGQVYVKSQGEWLK